RDWSADVCSSDLGQPRPGAHLRPLQRDRRAAAGARGLRAARPGHRRAAARRTPGRPGGPGGAAMSQDLVPTTLRNAMAHFASGVTVVTTLADKHDHAMTANSLCSVSLEPPMMLVCVGTDNSWRDSVGEAGIWGVSILPASGRPAATWL